jgi:hypothetical protein
MVAEATAKVDLGLDAAAEMDTVIANRILNTRYESRSGYDNGRCCSGCQKVDRRACSGLRKIDRRGCSGRQKI